MLCYAIVCPLVMRTHGCICVRMNLYECILLCVHSPTSVSMRVFAGVRARVFKHLRMLRCDCAIPRDRAGPCARDCSPQHALALVRLIGVICWLPIQASCCHCFVDV